MKKFMPIILLLMLFSVAVLINVTKPITSLNYNTIGVWWWNNKLDSTYLDFAQKNGVSEIYYYTSSFNDKTQNFIQNAKTKDIRVYWLTGEYEWIEDNDSLYQKLDEFILYQTENENIFDGVHFDIEPHQHPQFEDKRTEILLKFVQLIINLRIKYPNLYLEYDIPCWLDDKLEINGQKMEAYKYIINNADRVTLMSYRDSSEAIYNFAKDEIEYAKSLNKTINLAVETQDVGEDIVSFFEEGNKYMLSELNKLKKAIPENFGIAIHHIVSWKELN